MLTLMEIAEKQITRYKQPENFIPAGKYYIYLGRPTDKQKKMFNLVACQRGNRFLWLAPYEQWVKRLKDGQLFKEPNLSEEPDWSLIGFNPDTLRDWQKRIVKEAWNYLRAGLNYRKGWIAKLGAGKTLAGLLLCQLFEQNETAVLVDRYLHSTWKDEAEKWGLACPIVSTYESCHKLKGIKCLIIDECFVAGTLVQTLKGLKPIEKIGKNDLVASYNHELKKVEYKKVLGLLTKRPQNSIVKVSLDDKNFYATENHLFWTGERYEEIGKLNNKNIYIRMRILREKERDVESCSQQEEEILQHKLFCKMEDGKLPSLCGKFKKGYTSSYSKSKRSQPRRDFFLAQETTQTSLRKNKGPNQSKIHSKRGETPCEGWQWYGDDKSRNSTVSTNPSTELRTQLCCNHNAKAKGRLSRSKLSKDRPCIPSSKNRNRSEWGKPQFNEKERTGQEETIVPKRVRVEYFNPSKQGDTRELVDCSRVYCLAVEGNNNFFIGEEGLLVHNCLKAKNPDTKRAKDIFNIGKQCELVVGFTGIATAGKGPMDFRWLRVVEDGCVPADENAWKFIFGLDTQLKEVGFNKAYITTEWDNDKVSEFVSPFIHTVDPEEINSELPEITTKFVYCPTPKQYDLVKAGGATSKGVHKRLAQIKQITDGFIYDDNDRAVRVDKPKLKPLKDFIEQLGEPVVIVANWSETIEILKEEFAEYMPAVVQGGVSDFAIQIKSFQQGTTNMLIANAGFSKGMNLQHRCRVVIFLSVSSKPDDYQQMIGRVYRPGQKNAVQIVHFVCENTVDMRLVELVQAHTDCSEQFIDKLLIEELGF